MKKRKQNFCSNFKNNCNFHSKDSDVMVQSVYCPQPTAYPKKCYNDCLLSTNRTYSDPLWKNMCLALTTCPTLLLYFKLKCLHFSRHVIQSETQSVTLIFSKGCFKTWIFTVPREMLFRFEFHSC